MPSTGSQLAHDEIRRQLQRILQSHVFLTAHRSRLFLRHVVEKSLAGSLDDLKEYAIAMDVFERGSSYDPRVDATVRVEAARLRGRLREYYDQEGKSDPIQIEIPKGSYAAVFTERPQELGSVAAEIPSNSQPAGKWRSFEKSAHRLLGKQWFWVAFLPATAALLFATAWLLQRPVMKSTPSPVPSTVSIAVLPFANKTGDPSRDYLADGVTRALTRQLSEVPNLTVISNLSARDVKAGTILTGDVRLSGTRLVVTAELSNVNEARFIFDREYLPEELDLMPVQSDILRDVVNGLRIDLDPSHSNRLIKPASTSAKAYELFMRGLHAAETPSAARLHEAAHYFEEAVHLDPKFAIAWQELGQVHTMLGMYFEAPKEHLPLAKQYSRQAVALDNSLRDAHGVLGIVHLLYDWDYSAAEAELNSAETQKRTFNVLSCTVHLLDRTGRSRNAEELLHSMLETNPKTVQLICEMGCLSYYRRQYAAAVEYYTNAHALDPSAVLASWGLGKSYALQGKYREAVYAIDQFKAQNGFEPPLLTAERGYALGAWGKKREAEAAIHTLIANEKAGFVDPYFVSIIYLAMHDREAAFTWLDRALDVKSTFLISILSDPKWQSSRGDPKFQSIVRKMGPGVQ